MASRCEVTGKRCFASKSEIRRTMKRLSAVLRIYRCEFCGSLHLTKRRGADPGPKPVRKPPSRHVDKG